MKVEYSAVFTREENGLYSVEFPNLPGCVTDGESRADAVSNAQEALSGWLASHLVRGRVFDPSDTPESIRAPRNGFVRSIAPSRRTALAVWMRLHRSARGWSQIEAARRLGVSRQTYRRFEDPDAANPGPAMIEGIENLYQETMLSVQGKDHADKIFGRGIVG